MKHSSLFAIALLALPSLYAQQPKAKTAYSAANKNDVSWSSFRAVMLIVVL